MILNPTPTKRPRSADYCGDPTEYCGTPFTGEWYNDVAGYQVTYPVDRGWGADVVLRDIAFVASLGYGASGFMSFDADGDPYGFPLPKAARARLKAMRAYYGPGGPANR